MRRDTIRREQQYGNHAAEHQRQCGVHAPERAGRMGMISPVCDEADDSQDADHGDRRPAAPDCNRDTQQENYGMNDGLKGVQRLSLSDWGDNEDVDDQ